MLMLWAVEVMSVYNELVEFRISSFLLFDS